MMDRQLQEFVANAVSLLGYDDASSGFTNELQIKAASGATYSILLSSNEPYDRPDIQNGSLWINLDVTSVGYKQVLRLTNTDPSEDYEFTWTPVTSMDTLLDVVSVMKVPASTLQGPEGDQGETGPRGRKGFTGDTGLPGATGDVYIPYSAIEDKVVAALNTSLVIVGDDYIEVNANTIYPLELGYSVKVLTNGTDYTDTNFNITVTNNVNSDRYSIDEFNVLTMFAAPSTSSEYVIVLYCEAHPKQYNMPFYASKSVQIRKL